MRLLVKLRRLLASAWSKLCGWEPTPKSSTRALKIRSMSAVKDYETRFRGISAIAALELLCWTLGARYDGICIGETKTTLASLYDYAETLAYANAEDVSIGFYGGPKPRRFFKDASLLAMVVDRILFAEMHGERCKVQQALMSVQ